MLLTLSAWTTSFALYLLFAGQASGAELCAGALAAAAGAALQVYLHRSRACSVRLDLPWGWLAARIGASLARDTVAVGGALVRASMGRPVHGYTQRQPFMVGGDMEAGRRAVVILAASIAPNGFVEQVVPEDEALMMHRLVPAPPREDHRWPA